SGASSISSTSVIVADTKAPVLTCPSVSAASECTGPGGAPLTLVAAATDACGGAGVITNDHNAGGADASGTYPPGPPNVAFTATDASGHQPTCSTAVTVRDTQPPTLTLQTSPTTLWPPNHTPIPVHLTWTASDACTPDPRVELVSATSSEP